MFAIGKTQWVALPTLVDVFSLQTSPCQEDTVCGSARTGCRFPWTFRCQDTVCGFAGTGVFWLRPSLSVSQLILHASIQMVYLS